MLHKLAVITVIYKNYNILKDFVNSFEKQSNKNFQIFLSDLSQEKQRIHLPEFAKLINGQNKGYAYGINLGLKEAVNQGHSQFAIINSDTKVDPNFIQNVETSLNNYPESIIAGKIYYEKGYEYHKDRYSSKDLGKVLWYAGGKVDWNHALTIHRGVDEVDKTQYDRLERTNFVTGCFMSFTKRVLDRIGFWDERYFLYYEDADFCERAKRKGIDLMYDPSIVVYHKNAQSTEGSGSKLQQKYQQVNRLRFGLKYAPLKTKAHLLFNYVFKK